MKYFALYCILLSMVACKANDSKKNCSLNDKSVDCALFEPAATGEGHELRAKLTSAINITEDRFEMLENNEDIKEKTVRGHQLTCGLSTLAGKTFKYKVEGDKLSLAMEGEEGLEVFERVDEKGAGLLGSWRKREVEKGEEDMLTLSFAPQSLTMSLFCRFGVN